MATGDSDSFVALDFATYARFLALTFFGGKDHPFCTLFPQDKLRDGMSMHTTQLLNQ